MKNTFTCLETIKTSDGNTIIFNAKHLSKFFEKTFEENFASLTPEEKQEAFHVNQEYEDLLIKMWKEPLRKITDQLANVSNFQESIRNPIDEYEYLLLAPKEEGVTEEDHNLKIERSRQHKEWYEKQIS
jgi:hypothetical protein